MHQWGDENVDWKGINDAAEFVGDYCARWARFRGQTKEKYGTVRFYAHLGYLSLHGLVYPGYVYSQFPNWLWTLDIYVISPLLQKTFSWVWNPWQKFIYKRAYKLAVKKWPHLRKEILSGADHLELLDDCDDIKLNWYPPSFSDKDKKRIGNHVLEYIETLRKELEVIEDKHTKEEDTDQEEAVE